MLRRSFAHNVSMSSLSKVGLMKERCQSILTKDAIAGRSERLKWTNGVDYTWTV